jgi:fumarate hydratase class II
MARNAKAAEKPAPARSRIEHDSLGPVEVPAERLWGAQTQRSLVNFSIGGPHYRWNRPVIGALGLVKKCAALANGEFGRLPRDKVELIVRAAGEVAQGMWDDEFPLLVFQTGSGTQTNMNANEVIANRAAEILGELRGRYTRVHPNDHVNMAQSTNDVFPTATRLALLFAHRDLVVAARALATALTIKAHEFSAVLKVGRTHLQDAVPMTLGQEFGGYAAQVRQGIARIESTLERVGQVPLGGTATGTGLNTHPEFAERVRARIAAGTGLTVLPPADPFEAQAARDALVEASGALKTVAVSLTKIANDIRWMGSGPRAGLAEIALPELQKGSSIMPGKVNPVIPEVVTQVSAQVIGNDAAITVGGLQGHFELNVFIPMMARNLLGSIGLLAAASRLFAEKCVDGIEPNRETLERYAELTLSAATALNPHIGYDRASEIVKEAASSGRSLREVAREAGIDEETLDSALDYRKMARPHGS